MAEGFVDRIGAAVARTGPLCAGIDPSGALLSAWGLRDDAHGLRAFCRTCIDAFCGVVGVVKPQAAFFERHGSAGMAELERFVAEANSAGLVVIVDAKRGDIDSTAEAYADAWVNPASPLAGDAVTVHAYLGLGALAPLVRLAGARRPRGPGRGQKLQPRGPRPATGAHRRRRGGRGHAPGGGGQSEHVGRGAEGNGGCSRRRHPSTVEFRVIPAWRGNSRPRARCSRCGSQRHRGRALRDVRSARSCRAAHGDFCGTDRTARRCAKPPDRWFASCRPAWPESGQFTMARIEGNSLNVPGRGAMVSPCPSLPHSRPSSDPLHWKRPPRSAGSGPR